MTLKTLRVYISYTRRAIRDLKKMKLSVPGEDYDPAVHMRGDKLIVDGEIYTPKQLEALAGTKSEFQLPALAILEARLGELEYERVKLRKRRDKLTVLDEETADMAIIGIELVNQETEMEFLTWLNTGSSGYKKTVYYVKFGATTVNRGLITSFLGYIGVDTVAELYDKFDGVDR